MKKEEIKEVHILNILSFKNIYIHIFLFSVFSGTVTVFVESFEEIAEKENLQTLNIIDNLNRIDMDLTSLLSKRMSAINYDQINFAEREFYKYIEKLEKVSLDKNMNGRNGIYFRIKEKVEIKLRLFEKFKSFNAMLINFVSYFYNTYEEVEKWDIDHSIHMEIDKLLFATLQDFITLQKKSEFNSGFEKINDLLEKFPNRLYIQTKTKQLFIRIKKMKELTARFQNITEEIQKISLQEDVENYRNIIYSDILEYQEIYRYILSISISVIALIMFFIFNWSKNEFKTD
jgi:hypothetical protein